MQNCLRLHDPLPCPCCSEPTGLIIEKVDRKVDTIRIKFFCPGGCAPVLVIDSEKADTRLSWTHEGE